MQVSEVTVGKQLIVGAPANYEEFTDIVGFGVGEKYVRGAAFVAGPAIVGNPLTYSQEGKNKQEASLMIARSSNTEAQGGGKGVPSIFKISNKCSNVDPKKIDVMIGEPSVVCTGGTVVAQTKKLGPVGLQVHTDVIHFKNEQVSPENAEDPNFLIQNMNWFKFQNDVTFEIFTDTVQVGGDYEGTTYEGNISADGDIDLGGDLSAQGEVYSNNKGHRLSNKKNLPFDMPHPNRKGWRLRHVCIEGPEIAVYCRGKVGEDGIINLPSFWEGLVNTDDMTINLTPYGNWQELYVKEIIDGKQVRVINNITGGKVNADYYIIGRRLDDDLIVEYEGESHEDYPGGNEGYSFSWENDNMERLVKEVARERLQELESQE